MTYTVFNNTLIYLVTDFKVGDEVFGLMPGGAYAEVKILPHQC